MTAEVFLRHRVHQDHHHHGHHVHHHHQIHYHNHHRHHHHSSHHQRHQQAHPRSDLDCHVFICGRLMSMTATNDRAMVTKVIGFSCRPNVGLNPFPCPGQQLSWPGWHRMFLDGGCLLFLPALNCLLPICINILKPHLPDMPLHLLRL